MTDFRTSRTVLRLPLIQIDGETGGKKEFTKTDLDCIISSIRVFSGALSSLILRPIS